MIKKMFFLIIVLINYLLRFRKSVYSWLQSGTKYKFKTFVVTQASDANMTDELTGVSSEVEVDMAIYFRRI